MTIFSEDVDLLSMGEAPTGEQERVLDSISVLIEDYGPLIVRNPDGLRMLSEFEILLKRELRISLDSLG
jgi:hypothetical protein